MAKRRDNSAVQYANEGLGPHFAIPMPGKRTSEVLLASGALPGAGAYQLSSPADIFKSRLIHLNVTVTYGAAGGRVSIIPEVSSDPEGSDNTWFPIGITDGLPSVVD